MPFGFHGLDLVVILVIALLVFGPKRLPEMGSAIGKGIKEFRKGMNELTAPKEEKEEQKSAVNLEAIDREIASKKADSEYKTPVVESELVTPKTSRDTSATESKVD